MVTVGEHVPGYAVAHEETHMCPAAEQALQVLGRAFAESEYKLWLNPRAEEANSAAETRVATREFIIHTGVL